MESSPESQETHPVAVTFFTDEEAEAQSAVCPRSPRDLNSGLSDSSVLGSSVLCCQPTPWMGNAGDGLSLPRLPSKNTLNPQEEEAGVSPDALHANQPGSGSEIYRAGLCARPRAQGQRGGEGSSAPPRSAGAVCRFPASTPQNTGQQMLSK